MGGYEDLGGLEAEIAEKESWRRAFATPQAKKRYSEARKSLDQYFLQHNEVHLHTFYSILILYLYFSFIFILSFHTLLHLFKTMPFYPLDVILISVLHKII